MVSALWRKARPFQKYATVFSVINDLYPTFFTETDKRVVRSHNRMRKKNINKENSLKFTEINI